MSKHKIIVDKGPTSSEILKKATLKVTPARVEVLKLLTKVKKPLAIDEIIDRLKLKTVDKVTVYRTMKKLTDSNVVREVELRHGHAHYEINDKAHDHHHLVCVRCGRVEDFVGCNFEKASREALQQVSSFKTILQHSMELFGVCRECSRLK